LAFADSQELNDSMVNVVENPIFKLIPHAVILSDISGKIVYANEHTKNIFGFSPAQLKGKPLSTLFTPEDMEFLYPNLLFLAKNNKQFQGELMLMKRNGIRFFAYLHMVPLLEAGLTLYCLQDIDSTKRLKNIVHSGSYDDLIKMANGIAHEIRNPLVSIGGFINRIKRICELGEENLKNYQNVLTNLKRIETIVKKVQAFVTMPRPEFRPWNIRELVEAVLTSPEYEERVKGVKIKQRLSDTNVYVDRQLIEKVFSILLENSLDAIEAENGEIEIYDERDDSFLKIYFKDNGVGISPTDLPYIFTPFFSTKAHGIGIDLATARKIIQAHNGLISVESHPALGTTFAITIPIERRRKIRRELLEEQGIE